MSSISVAGDTSGAITISAPSVAGSGVLTLPTGTDTLVGKATTDTLTNKTLGAGTVFPAGAVLQVVSASYSTAVSNSTNVYADTGLTKSITPTSATSKILVMVTQSFLKSVGNASTGVDVKLFRAATDLGTLAYNNGYTGASSTLYGSTSFQYLDSPATTSATTYKTQFRNDTNAASVTVQPDSLGTSTITLMEIAG